MEVKGPCGIYFYPFHIWGGNQKFSFALSLAQLLNELNIIATDGNVQIGRDPGPGGLLWEGVR